MAKLIWDAPTERIYETGDKNVALYVYQSSATTPTGATAATHYSQGVAWNGITAITESPSGAEATDLWADDTKYATMRSAEQFGGTIEAYTYPDAWMACDGSVNLNGVVLGQQARRAFGLAFITTVGNDTELNDYGEKLHLIYGATASPSERSYATINDSPDAITFSWEFETTPVDVGEINGVTYKKISCITIDKKKVSNLDTYEAFKKYVFGDTNITPHLPEPATVLSYFANTQVYDYTLTTEKPDDWETNYMDYFTKDENDVYVQVGYQGETLAWEASTYYKRTIHSDT